MFGEYLKIGFDHILDPNGLDHLLFLVALVVLYAINDWKKVLILATAFTLGHSLTLIISTLGLFSIQSRMVEILIAVSIFLTALDNFVYDKGASNIKYRYITALIFGLVHGLGFSNSLKSILFEESIVTPLLAFNIGVELGQVLIVLITLIIGWIMIDLLKLKRKHWVSGVSFIIMIWALKMIIERF